MTPESESCDLIISVATKRSPLIRLSSTLLIFSKASALSEVTRFEGFFGAGQSQESVDTRPIQWFDSVKQKLSCEDESKNDIAFVERFS